jgi:hypothetical protein
MTPYDFVKEFCALKIPLTGDEWFGLRRIFEKLSPGITSAFVLPDVSQQSNPADADLQCPACYSQMREIKECPKCGHTEKP